MFASLKEQPADKILALMQMFKDDPREQKIDLGVGVYKDAQGHTPIMRAVKAAEKALWDVQDTKTYVGLVGDVAFSDVMIDLLLGKT
ncbi:MAG: aromatic amino acid aminotransferase, partial [Paracoccaceae bacterium]